MEWQEESQGEQGGREKKVRVDKGEGGRAGGRGWSNGEM